MNNTILLLKWNDRKWRLPECGAWWLEQLAKRTSGVVPTAALASLSNSCAIPSMIAATFLMRIVLVVM